MSTDKRHQRMLEELLAVPGNGELSVDRLHNPSPTLATQAVMSTTTPQRNLVMMHLPRLDQAQMLIRRHMCRLQSHRTALGICQPRNIPLCELRVGASQDGHTPLQSVRVHLLSRASVHPSCANCLLLFAFGLPGALANGRKSVTLDSWTRDQITAVKAIGNRASNQIWNPNEALHPPPTSLNAEERDSEIEKFIRRKYEQGAFRADRHGEAPRAAPTSLNRAREADGRLPSGSVTSLGALSGNRQNPELNDIVARKPAAAGPAVAERDLPPLPVGGSGAPPRPRPTRSGSGTPSGLVGSSSAVGGPGAAPSWQAQNQPAANGGYGHLVDVNGAVSSTLPLQINVNGYNPFQQQQQQYSNSPPMPSTAAFSTSPVPSFNGFSASPNQFAVSPNQFPASPGQFATTPHQFASSPGQIGMHSTSSGTLQAPGTGYGLSSSAPHGNMLASFDPLHPASQQQQFQQQQLQQSVGMAGSFSPQNGYAQMQQGSFQQQGGYLSPGSQMGYMGTSPQGVMGMGGYQNGGGQWMR